MVFPYLNFNGNCEEAFKLYARAFGGKNLLMQKYGDLAPEPGSKDHVMHAEMDLDDFGRISGADATWPFDKGSAMNAIIRTSEEKLRKAWGVLSEEGEIVMALEPFEYENNTLMGTIRDKYGFTWIFTEDQ